METPTNRQSVKFLAGAGVLTGLIATLTMDCLSVMAHRLGVTAPLSPHVAARWFAWVVRLKPFHPDMAHSPAVRNEMAIGFAAHYAIGITLALFYRWYTTRLGLRPRQLRCALGFSVCTNALPWLIMFPAMGYGFFGAHGPPGTRLFLSSFCSHAFYGLGLWIAMCVIRAKTFDGLTEPHFKGETAGQEPLSAGRIGRYIIQENTANHPDTQTSV